MFEDMLNSGWLTILLAMAIVFGLVFVTSYGGLRWGAIVLGLGLLAPWLIWLILLVASWLQDGPDSRAFAFVLGAGAIMVGAMGSLFWLGCAIPGLLFGLLGHRWLKRAVRA